jgi:4-hydroxy-2-oxoheptanedioate aldolase
MLRENKIKQRLKAGEPVLGTFVKFADASTIEILAHAGFDFFVLDNEHVAMNRESMVNILRAADSVGITAIVRVKENNPSEILQALDSGAHGIQVPQVNTRAEAEAVVRSVKYAPLGERGFAPSHRAAGYGFMDPVEFAKKSNEETLIVCYCETRESIENLDQILSLPELDVCFIGPFDLSQSLGHLAQPKHPAVVKQIESVVQKATKAGKAIGIVVGDPAEARQWIEKGIHYMTISSDQGMMGSQAKNLARAIRGD